MNIATFAGGLVVVAVISSVATYSVVKPDADYCEPALEHQKALNQITIDKAVEQALANIEADAENDFRTAVPPREGLNPDREGGMGWDDSIR